MKLAPEMILHAARMICVPIRTDISGPMKPTTEVEPQGREGAATAYARWLQGLLVARECGIGGKPRWLGPCPSKCMTFCPPCRARAQALRSLPRATSSRSIPKLALAACVPAIDWEHQIDPGSRFG